MAASDRFYCTVFFLTFNTLLILFSNKMLVIKAGMHNMLVRIANRVDHDQTVSSEAILCGSALFVYAFLADN